SIVRIPLLAYSRRRIALTAVRFIDALRQDGQRSHGQHAAGIRAKLELERLDTAEEQPLGALPARPHRPAPYHDELESEPGHEQRNDHPPPRKRAERIAPR